MLVCGIQSGKFISFHSHSIGFEVLGYALWFWRNILPPSSRFTRRPQCKLNGVLKTLYKYSLSWVLPLSKHHSRWLFCLLQHRLCWIQLIFWRYINDGTVGIMAFMCRNCLFHSWIAWQLVMYCMEIPFVNQCLDFLLQF